MGGSDMRSIIGVIGLALTLAGAGTAHADKGTFSGSKGDYDAHAYWVDVASVGVAGSVVQAQNLGMSICMKLDNGLSTGQVVDNLTTDVSSALGALMAVDGAEWHFCPEYY
jgi:hypothetical protein